MRAAIEEKKDTIVKHESGVMSWILLYTALHYKEIFDLCHPEDKEAIKGANGTKGMTVVEIDCRT